MAQSIRAQLNAGKVEVEHKGQNAEFELPMWMQLDNATLDDESALVEHLRQNGLLLPVLHNGLSQCVIGVRAVARPNPTKSEPNPDFPTSELRRKARQWEPNKLPSEDGNRLSPEQKAIRELVKAGYSEEVARSAIQNINRSR